MHSQSVYNNGAGRPIGAMTPLQLYPVRDENVADVLIKQSVGWQNPRSTAEAQTPECAGIEAPMNFPRRADIIICVVKTEAIDIASTVALCSPSLSRIRGPQHRFEACQYVQLSRKVRVSLVSGTEC